MALFSDMHTGATSTTSSSWARPPSLRRVADSVTEEAPEASTPCTFDSATGSVCPPVSAPALASAVPMDPSSASSPHALSTTPGGMASFPPLASPSLDAKLPLLLVIPATSTVPCVVLSAVPTVSAPTAEHSFVPLGALFSPASRKERPTVTGDTSVVSPPSCLLSGAVLTEATDAAGLHRACSRWSTAAALPPLPLDTPGGSGTPGKAAADESADGEPTVACLFLGEICEGADCCGTAVGGWLWPWPWLSMRSMALRTMALAPAAEVVLRT